MAARTRKPRHLLKGAEARLDGAAALLKRAADRLNTASAYAGDGASLTAYKRFAQARDLMLQAAVIVDGINREEVVEAPR